MFSLILAISHQIAFAQISLQSVNYGCTNEACTQICKLGVADCSSAIPTCEYGYFLFKQKYCVKCPGLSTNMRLECMDCNENPTTWDSWRKCTYSYQIQNGDATNGVFQKITEYQQTLYQVVAATVQVTSSDRQVDLPYEVSICEGCDEFCEDESDESCYFFEDEEIIDPQVGVKCLSGFQYIDSCVACPNNCQFCNAEGCETCKKGFVLSVSGSCSVCQDGCLACTNGDYSLECSECSFTWLESYYIPSMFLDQCESCNGQCIRCEYMTYDTTIDPQYLTRNLDVPWDEDVPQYIKRCRQCKQLYFVDNTGEECSPCNIANCVECYQDLGDGITTLTPDFTPKTGTFPTLCNKCQVGYKLSSDKLSCAAQGISSHCQTFNSDDSCSQCESGLMYDFVHTSCTTTKCSSKILNCIDCFTYSEPDADITYDSDGNTMQSNKQQLQCTKCANGFYADFFTGKCLPCDSNCQKCFQYTQSYNLTQMGQSYVIYSESQKLTYQNEQEEDTMCIQCNEGYDIYDNQCKGCGDGCTIKGESKCVFEYDNVYCSQCPAGQKSLISDLSDCAVCPQFCLGCRQRTQAEINLINPLFNPSNADLDKYSNLCYLPMSNIDPARNLYLDTLTFMPTACDFPGTARKCHYTATINVNIDCGTDDPAPDAIILSSIFKGKSSVAKLLLKTVDTYQNYLLLNNNNVQEINIIINIVGDVCEFTKPTAFRTYLQQNVFSLMKLNIKFTSSTPVIFSQIGQISFKNINNLEFENISFQYNYDAKTKIKDFGLIFLGKSSSLTVKQSKIDKENSLQYSIFTFNLTGVQNLKFQDTTFNQLTPLDQFIKQNFTIETNYTLTLQNVKFQQCYFSNNNYLFAQNPLNYSIINILSLTIYQSNFFKTNVFGTYATTESPQVQLNIESLIIEISSFNLSNILLSDQVTQSQISNVDVYSCQFINSVIFSLNTINFKNFYIAQNKFYNSTAFTTTVQVNSISKNAIFQLLNINMDSNQCNNINCLFILATPENTLSLKANLVINALQIKNTESSVDSEDIQYLESALAKFTSFQTITVNQISSVNNLGMIVYYFNMIKSIDVSNLLCDYPQEQIITVESDEGEIQIENPFLNKIPASEECGESLKLTQKYNFFCMYIGQYTHGVRLTNVVIRNMLLFDFSAITIQSYDSLEMNTTRTPDSAGLFYSSYDCEVVVLSQIQANNNTLIAQELGATLSLISILSTQIQQISINNANFQSNHLHKLSKYYTLPCATAFLILSQQGTLRMNNANFQYNRATQIINGVNHIVIKIANISNSNFISTNIFNGDWQAILSENQMDIVQIWQYFEVQSNGANLYIHSQQLIVYNCQFQESYGLAGNGIYIVTQGIGEVVLTSTLFIDISSNLEPKYSTQGGSLYIDATSAQLNLVINDVAMINCKSRVSGGCVWIGTGKNTANIQISDSSFIGCQSLTSQFMEVKFQDIFTQTVQMKTVLISNNKLPSFLSEIPLLSETEINQFKSTASVYTQTYGQLTLDDVSFTNILYSNILYITNLYSVYFNDVLFTENIIFSAPLVYLTVQTQGKIYFGSVMFVNNKEFTPNEYLTDCSVYYFNAPKEDTEQQTCDEWSYGVELVESYFDDEYYIIEDLSSKEYEEMTNSKYQWDEIDNVYQDTQVIQPIELEYHIEVAECVLYILYLELSNQTSAYVQIIEPFNQIKFEDVRINNNECSRCVYGLFQIINFDGPLQINQLNCVNNQISYFGCLSLTILKQFSDIEFNKPLIDQRLLQQTDNTYSIYINNSNFMNNSAKIGGGLTVIGLNVFLQTCEFTNNIGSIVGGGLYYSSILSNIQIFDSVFQSNTAQVGAALYVEGTQLSNQTKCMNEYDHNMGQSVYENPIGLTLLLNGIKYPTKEFNGYTVDGDVLSEKVDMIDTVVFEKEQFLNYPKSTDYLIVPSGQQISKYKYYLEETMEQIPYDWNISLVYLNRFNEIVNGESFWGQIIIEGRIQNSSDYDAKKPYSYNFTSFNTLYYDVFQSMYDLNDLIITFDPYLDEQLYLELRVTCDIVSKPVIQNEYPYNVLGSNSNYYILINIRTYPCQMGEIYIDQKCQACEAQLQQYNVILNANECKDMDSDKMIAVTPVGIQLQKYWWRPYIDNDEMQICLHLPANCKGGWIPGNPSCYTGHIGALCESCDLYGQFNELRYSNTEKYVCSPCADTKDSSIGILVGNTLATVASITLSVKGTYELVNQFLMIKSLTLMGVRLNQNANNLATLIKMLTNYFQIIQILNTFQLIIPKGLTKTTDAAGNPTKASSFSLDCILEPMTDINMLYFRMIWALVMPCIYLLIYFVQYFFGVLIGKIPYKAAMISTAFIYMFIFAQPTLVGGFIQLGSSRNISGYSWVQADVAYRSDTTDHQLWSAAFVAPMIVIWVVLLPLILLYRIYLYRFHLSNRHIRSRWGFFYNEYQDSAYYWEFVKITEKMLMVIFLTFYEDYVLIKGALVVLVLLYYSWIQINSKPYQNGELNYIDRFSTVVCLVTLITGLLIYTAQQYDTQYLIIILFVLLGIFNLAFLIQIVYMIFEGYLVKLSDKVDAIRDKINAIKPNLRYQHPKLRKLLQNKKLMNERVNQLWIILRQYTKQQIKNRRENLPKYEQILNAPYDFAAAKLPKEVSATIIPVEEMPEYLNSALAQGAKGLFQKVNELQDLEKQENKEKSSEQTKDGKKKDEGFLGGLKQYMPKSVKDNLEKAEKKIEEAKKLKEQADNAIAKGKKLAGTTKDKKEDDQNEEKEQLIEQKENNQNEEKQQQREQKEEKGLFGQFSSFLPDSVKKQLKEAEEQKKLMEQRIQEAQNMKNKLEKQAQQVKDGTILKSMIPDQVLEEKKKIEEQIQQAKSQVQTAMLQIDEIQSALPTLKDESPNSPVQQADKLLNDVQFQKLNEESIENTFKVPPTMQITQSNFFQRQEENK